jgi:hypothetical protein
VEVGRPRYEEVNMLDLDLFHEDLKLHLKKMIDDPDNLIGDNPTNIQDWCVSWPRME